MKVIKINFNKIYNQSQSYKYAYTVLIIMFYEIGLWIDSIHVNEKSIITCKTPEDSNGVFLACDRFWLCINQVRVWWLAVVA
jgi:hypothetical protein